MKELKEIMAALKLANTEGRRAALATLVHVEGSSYRRPGARMLITDNGKITGAISGGCLEGDVLRKALLAMEEGKAKLVTYDTSDEEPDEPGLGLGCNGVIRVLIEPLDPSNQNNPLRLLEQTTTTAESSVLVSLFDLTNAKAEQPGTCFLYGAGQVLSAESFPAELESFLTEDAQLAYGKNSSCTKTYLSGKKQLTAFFEFIQSPISLTIIGAGNDAFPLVNLAGVMGWNVAVLDGRPDYANTNRFASGCRVVVAKPEKALASLFINQRSVFVLMTHNYNYDLAVLRQLITYNVKYIGVLGPRKKLNRMLEQLHSEGIELTPEQLAKIYGPVGLDLGAETPEEIALSIAAEIKAVMANRKGQSLREKDSVLHSRRHQKIEQVYIRQE